jgi:hypothetical protein
MEKFKYRSGQLSVMGGQSYDEKEGPKESVHVRVDKELYENMEKLRILPHSKFAINRSDIYNETLFYGYRIQQIKKELGDKEFDRIWTLLQKLNLQKVDLSKII